MSMTPQSRREFLASITAAGAVSLVAPRGVDARTVRSVTKKAGKVTLTQTSVVAPDGKTRTLTTTGVNAAGQKVNNVAVYEKQ